MADLNNWAGMAQVWIENLLHEERLLRPRLRNAHKNNAQRVTEALDKNLDVLYRISRDTRKFYQECQTALKFTLKKTQNGRTTPIPRALHPLENHQTEYIRISPSPA